MNVQMIWICLAIMAAVVSFAAWDRVRLLDENFELKEERAKLKAEIGYCTSLIDDMTDRVNQAHIAAARAQGWHRTGAPVLYTTEILPALLRQ